MNTAKAIIKSCIAQLRGADFMVFDWEKAARILHDRKPFAAFAGLKDDFECTGAMIYKQGHPILLGADGEKPYTFLGSCWAKPMLVLLDEKGQPEEMECFTTDKNSPYCCHTYWPREAVRLL